MEELENTLNSSNPITIAQVFSKIIKNIRERYQTGTKDGPELKFLKEKCIVPDPLIYEVADVSIISLVEDGILPVDTTLADFITLIPLTKCYKSLIRVIGDLLYLEMKTKNLTPGEYTNNYNLWFPQHPYITILNENPNTWNYILNEIKFLSKNENCDNLNGVFLPVYLYALCNPVSNETTLLKMNTWNFLLNRKNVNMRIYFNIISLLQVDTKNNLEANSELLSEAITRIVSGNQVYNSELIILWQISLLHNLAVNKFDLRPCIFSLKSILESLESLVSINCLLLILSKTITICSPVYLLDLLKLCKIVMSFGGKEVFVLESLKISLLHWLASPSILTEGANKIANNIFNYIENYEILPVPYAALESFSREHRILISTNNVVSTSVEISLLLQHFAEENNILEWIEKVERSPSCLISDLYCILSGLFLSKRLNSESTIRIFMIILKHVELNKMLSTQLLTLILYKLSNTTDSNLHFVLLRALPKLVMLRDNIPKIMAALQALSKASADMYNFGLSLMFDAWKMDSKCYTYLESMLVQHSFSEKKWETYVTKSYILKELCERKPELYGKEMVAHLSKILNECNDEDGSLPCSIAIEGIRILCKSEVIDVVTTWATLAPKFKNDTRAPVIRSLCSLIHEIPHLPYTESYLDLQEDVVKTLWDYVLIGNPEITEAALNGLTAFSLEQISCSFPEQFLDPNAIQDRKKTVVGVPQMVPGRTWVKFLIENNASKEAADFIIKMISLEIAGYLKYVYQVKGHKEPVNYDYLPTHSIVRGIGEFIKTWANKWKHSIHDILYIECLRIFSKEYSKPLPPLDWCFLQELLHDPETRDYCVDIASHQAILSGTARRLMENYIVAVTENIQDSDCINVIRNLKYLANSIQPSILKPFFETALAFGINKYESGSSEFLESILEYIQEVLQNTDIQETNKVTIAQVLCDKICIMEVKSELFNLLLKCVILLPKKSLDELTALQAEISSEWLEKVAKIRCSIASHTNIAPLIWLNDIIEVSSKMERNIFIQQQFIKVFRKHINNPSECALWLLELIGQIQAKVADRCDEREVLYFFDVFILSVIEFSGYSMFVVNENSNCDVRRKELLPQAFYTLLSMNDWSVCTTQALEWLFHMNAEETIPKEYRNIFGLTLWSLRHDEEFIKNSKWMKYLSSNVVSD